ncbi:MAG: hypothetical protein WBM50_02900, partial [Acidimicrobiales bacterium]
MNGRCESDPFDQAIDVCPSCYGEFCSQCLVETKVRKHPLCRECALIVSGLRGGGKPVVRGDKKSAKQRRATLKQKPVTKAFEYFDVEDHRGAQPVSNRGSNGRWLAKDDPRDGAGRIDGADTGEAEGDRPGEPSKLTTSAIDQLGVIRETGVAPPEAQRPAAVDATADTGGKTAAHPDAGDDGADQASAPFRRPRPFIGSAGGEPAPRSTSPSGPEACSADGEERRSQPTRTASANSTATYPFAADRFTSEPGTTDRLAADPFTPEPGITDPFAADPFTPEPGIVDPLAADPFTPEPGIVEPLAADPFTPEPGTTDPFTGDPFSGDPFSGDPFSGGTVAAGSPGIDRVELARFPSEASDAGAAETDPWSRPSPGLRHEPAPLNSFDVAVFEADPRRTGALDEDLFDSESHHGDPFEAPAFDSPPSDRQPFHDRRPDPGSPVPGDHGGWPVGAAPLPRRRGD